MAKGQLESQPDVPEAHTCPTCGSPIFLGDTVCTTCGYTVQRPLLQQLRDQPPNVVAIAGFAVGVMIALGALGVDPPWQIVMGMIGFGLIMGGGIFYALHLLFFDDKRERKS